MEFKLRSWNLNDLESLVRYANNYNIAKNLTNQFPHPYTKENGESFIAMATKNDPLTIFAIEINGQAAGGIGLHLQQDIHCKNAELGYWLAEPFWGKGIITRAIKQIVAYGFKTFEIDRIFARPFGYNLGSQKVLTKSGFLLEGKFEKTIYKFGEYQDELIYAVRK
jgi:RimJ/RimL family protein N-acetyltransferase